MTKILSGIFLWTGDYGVGKTTACLECGADPERIMFIDADVKGNKTVQDIKDAGYNFGKFVNLVEMVNRYDHPWQAYPDIFTMFRDMKAEDFDVVIIDPETIFYEIIREYVRHNQQEFDSMKAWKKSRGSGFKFYEGKISRHARKTEQFLLNLISSRVKAIHMTAHLKDKYDSNVVVGKIPEVSKMIRRTANMICWLQHNPDHTTPIMLFVKQYGKKVLVKGKGMRTKNITPRKAVPRENEYSVWDVIDRYLENPAHGRSPLPEEIITEDDQWIVDGTLNEFQKQAWFARIKARELEQTEIEEALVGMDSPLQVRVQELKEQGLVAPPMLRDKILEEIAEGDHPDLDAEMVTIDAIAKVL